MATGLESSCARHEDSSHVTIPSVDSVILPQQLPVTLEKKCSAAANNNIIIIFFPVTKTWHLQYLAIPNWCLCSYASEGVIAVQGDRQSQDFLFIPLIGQLFSFIIYHLSNYAPSPPHLPLLLFPTHSVDLGIQSFCTLTTFWCQHFHTFTHLNSRLVLVTEYF